MPNVFLSDQCFNELRAALAGSTQPGESGQTPPVVPPVQPTPDPVPGSGNWQADANIAALAQAFSHTTLLEWDWAQGGVTFDTNTRGKVGADGVFVASFVVPADWTSNEQASLTAIGYPAPTQGNQMSMSLTERPCDFTVTDPAISVSYGPTVTYCVGEPPRRWWDQHPMAVGLVPGRRYFVNVCNRIYPGGASSVDPTHEFGGIEFRVALRVPGR